jgi:hypothetical protein
MMLRPDFVSGLIRRMVAADILWHISAPDALKTLYRKHQTTEHVHNVWDVYTHTKQASEPVPGKDLRIHIDIHGKRRSCGVDKDVW